MSHLANRWQRPEILEAIFDELSDALFVYDNSLHIVGVNQAAQQLLGMTAQEMIGKHCQEIFRCTACESSCGMLHGLSESSYPETGTIHLHLESGRERLAVIRTVRLLDDTGGLEGVVAAVRDITAEALPTNIHIVAESRAMLELLNLVLSLQFVLTEFTEEETVPSDSQVVGRTWAKCNKDGSPDRRFRDNYQIPVVRYGTLLFSSPDGLDVRYICSNARLAEEFFKAWVAFKAIFNPDLQPDKDSGAPAQAEPTGLNVMLGASERLRKAIEDFSVANEKFASPISAAEQQHEEDRGWKIQRSMWELSQPFSSQIRIPSTALPISRLYSHARHSPKTPISPTTAQKTSRRNGAASAGLL